MALAWNRKDFLAVAGASALTTSIGTAAFAQAPGTNKMAIPRADASADADMLRVLSALLAFNAPPIRTTLPRIAREMPSFRSAVEAVLTQDGKPTVEPVAKVEHRIITGPAGPLLLRIYTPAGNGPFPVIVYFHGGGWVIANLDTYDAAPRSLANGCSAIVVSVAYRQSPEFKFPAAPLDAFAAYRYVLANAASMGGDPAKVAVAGESAGGNLAAGVTLQALSYGVKQPVHQLLVYPVAAFGGPPTLAQQQYATAIPLATPDLLWFTKYYLRSMTDAANPLASITKARSYRGLAAATIINAEIDPLRDDGPAYAAKLMSGGVKVTRKLYAGVTHEFFGMGAVVAKAKTAMDDSCAALKAAFASA